MIGVLLCVSVTVWLQPSRQVAPQGMYCFHISQPAHPLVLDDCQSQHQVDVKGVALGWSLCQSSIIIPAAVARLFFVHSMHTICISVWHAACLLVFMHINMPR